MQRIILEFIYCLLLANFAVAQSQYTGEHIFDTNVKSLKVAPVGKPYSPAIISLADDDTRLNVNFDYIDYDVHYLRYSVTHCNADWQPSGLLASEYVSGFNLADITDYKQSSSTFVHYYNYNFSLPNDELQLSKSGNYLLSVYEQDSPDKILFQTRFSVCENLVTVTADVTSRTDIDYNNEHQQVSFEVTYRPGVIANPYNELTAVVSQNSRDDNEAFVTTPMMVSTGKATYEHNRALIFPAGNEYRRMETVNTHLLTMGVQGIQYFEPYYHATLFPDRMRVEQPYLYDQTQYGRFTIRNAESDDSNTEADYMITHFALLTDEKLSGGNVFLQGEFTKGLPAEACLMHYADGSYTCDIMLKQGAYNYQYLWVPDGSSVGETSRIEGNKFQTINEYLIKIYARPSGERYDHFVGYGIAFGGR